MEENNTTTATTTQEGAAGAQAAAAGAASTQATGAQNAAQEGDKGAQMDSRFEEMLQRAVDRATNKLGNDNKKLREQIKKMEREKMTEDEIRALELKEKDEELTARERAIQEKENRIFALKAIKEIGLDDGSTASMDLVDFVMAEDEETISARIKAFDALVKRFVKAEVDRTFKNNGRIPGVGNTGATGDEGSKKNSVAVQLGQNAAQAEKIARSTLDHYLGGK